MKAFKINSKPAIALISAALSLSLKNKAGKKERQEIIKGLQYVMAKNRAKYNVDVLEINKFLFAGLIEIKSLEDTDDISFIEEVEVDVKIIKTEKNFDVPETFGKMLAKLRTAIEKEDRPESSQTEAKKEDCNCPFCKTRREVVQAIAEIKELNKE